MLGANGAMGAGGGEVFAAAGITTVFLARTRDKARAGRKRAEKLAKSTAIARYITRRLVRRGSGAGGRRRRPDLRGGLRGSGAQARATSSRSTSCASRTRSSPPCRRGCRSPAMCAGRSDELPQALPRHPLLQSAQRDRRLRADPARRHRSGGHRDDARAARERLGPRAGRTSDTPAFCGNRVGFKVLNECAQLAEEHGVAYIDALIGPHTGRAMAPLATIDFVGWDVHQAIVDNLLRQHPRRGARRVRACPRYMKRADRSAATSATRRATRAASSQRGQGARSCSIRAATRTSRRAADVPRSSSR